MQSARALQQGQARSVNDSWRFYPLILGQLALVAAATVPAWIFGAVQAPVIALCFLPILLAAVCWSMHGTRDPNSSAYLPWALIPLLCGLVWGGVQLVPLGTPELAQLSPAAAAQREASRFALPPSSPARTEAPLSLSPSDTRYELSLLALASLSFALAAHFFRKNFGVMLLLWALAISGCALALVGIAQQLSWNGRIYWVYPLRFGGNPFAAYVNRNNAAGFLNIALAAALGTLVYVFTKPRYQEARFGQAIDEPRQRLSLGGYVQAAVAWIGSLSSLHIITLTLVILCTTGVIASLSRGGILAMVGGLLITVATLKRFSGIGRRGILLLSVSLLGALGLIVWLGMGEALERRFQDLTRQRQGLLPDGRRQQWHDSVPIIRDFWLTGSGLGSYRVVYRPYEQQAASSRHVHIENQYLEALITGGVPALGMLLGAMIAMMLAIGYLARQTPDRTNLALATAGCQALASQALAAITDFGLYAGANLLAMAILMGCVAGRACYLARLESQNPLGLFSRRSAWRVPAAVASLVMVLLIVLGVLGWQEMRRVAAIEPLKLDARQVLQQREPTRQQAQPLAEQLSRALAWRPDDADALLVAARLQLLLYELDALEALRPNMPKTQPHILRGRASTAQLHHLASGYLASKDTQALEQLRGTPAVRDHLPTGVDYLVRMIEASPMSAEAFLRLAMLSFVPDPPLDEPAYLERLLALSPNDVTVLRVASTLHLDAGRQDAALTLLRRAVELRPEQVIVTIGPFVGRVGLDDLLRKAIPPDPVAVANLSRFYRWRSRDRADERAAIAAQIERLLPAAQIDAAHRHYAQGIAAELKGDLPTAISELRQALVAQPSQVSWQFILADLLFQTGQLDESLALVDRCLARAPLDNEYRALKRRVEQARAARSP